MKFLKDLKRTHYCGKLTAAAVGQEVILMGWVDTRRDHGGLVFVDLRDREGIVQVVLDPKNSATSMAKELRNEFVIAVRGVVRRRPEGMTNERIATGEVEVEVTQAEILSAAETPPFQINDPRVSETLRLKYRYLDLRSPLLQGHLITRHKVTQLTRTKLSELGFVEVETPILYKSTPEGARDYLVPSRVNPGHFYALPQSPQTLKQLLMIGGMDRYFQIARCFRDEDLRAERQPEFSQIDVEMSFVEVEDVIGVTEDLANVIWKEVRGTEVGKIPHLTYQEAMNTYGNDKPDLRNPLKLKDLAAVVAESGFKVFDETVARGDSVKGLAVPKAGEFSRGQLDKLTATAKQMGAKGLVWIKADAKGELTSPISKFFSEDKFKEIFKAAGGEPGGAVFIVADEFNIACAALSTLRNQLGHEMGLIDTSTDAFCWIVDFPLFEFDPEEKRWVARHHPFTMPKDEHLAILEEQREKEYGKVLAKAYDLVCNGHEIAGGSIRIHSQKVQDIMFKALGLTPEESQEKFGFFIEALQYGTPPHGGIAWGLDRLIMILCGTDAIRDVIAFPKTARATCLMSGAPGTVDRNQLIELGVRLGASAEKNLQKAKEEGSVQS